MSIFPRLARIPVLNGSPGIRANVTRKISVQCEGKAADAKTPDGLTDEQRAEMESAMADPEVSSAVYATVSSFAVHRSPSDLGGASLAVESQSSIIISHNVTCSSFVQDPVPTMMPFGLCLVLSAMQPRGELPRP